MTRKEQRAIKMRCYPTLEQQNQAYRTFGCCRKVWNLFLADWKKDSEAGLPFKRRTPVSYKAQFSYLKEVDSLALCNAQLNFEKAVRDHLKNPAWFREPRFKSRKRSRKSYTTNRVQNNIEVGSSWIKLPKMGRIPTKVHRKPKPGWVLKSATLSQDSAERWFISVLYEFVPHGKQLREPKHVVGLDWSSPEFYVDSEGKRANHPKPYHKLQKRLAREQRRLSRMQEGSHNWLKQKQIIGRIQARIKDTRQDWLHKQSRTIAKLWDVVCVEDLDMHGMQQALHFGKSVNDAGWGAFLVLLAYKAQEEGSRVIKAPRSFASTKTCSRCGCVRDMQLKERIYACHNCNLEIDRDYNAALNLKQWALSSLAE